MALKIDLSNASHGQPFGADACNQLQANAADNINSAAKALIGLGYDASKVYILYGCESSSAAGITSIAAGCIFYNGDVFTFAGTSFSDPGGGNVVVCNKTTSYADGTGTTFADGSTYYVLPSQHADFAASPTGTGTMTGSSASDYSNLVRVDGWRDGGTPTITALTGSITGGSVVYNRFKIVGKTFFWQVQVTGLTVGSTPAGFTITTPSAIVSYTWANPNGLVLCGLYNTGSDILIGILNSGYNNVIVAPFGGGTLANGTKAIHINLVAELK